MSILQSPRVRDGSQNLEVSQFVVDMTNKSWFITMPWQSDLHDCLNCVSSFFSHSCKNEHTSQLMHVMLLRCSHQQMDQQDTSSHLVQQMRTLRMCNKQEETRHHKLLLKQWAPLMDPLLRWKHENNAFVCLLQRVNTIKDSWASSQYPKTAFICFTEVEICYHCCRNV